MNTTGNTTGVDVSECGRTKGCYLSNCDDPNSASCEYGVTWSQSTAGADGETAFELFGSATSMSASYVALGLSFDVNMVEIFFHSSPGKGGVNTDLEWS